MGFDFILSHPSIFIILITFTIVALILLFWKRTATHEINPETNVIINPVFPDPDDINTGNHSRSHSYEYLPSQESRNNQSRRGTDPSLSTQGPSLNNSQEVRVKEQKGKKTARYEDDLSSPTYVNMTELMDSLENNNVDDNLGPTKNPAPTSLIEILKNQCKV